MKQNKTPQTIKDLKPGQSAVVSRISLTGALKKRLLDMGITPGVPVTVLKVAPLGDPIEMQLRGYRLSIRKSDAKHIKIDPDKGDAVCRQKR